jgi:serine/threonine protein kinase
VRDCLSLEPNKRPTCSDLFKHAFFDEIRKEMEGEMEYLYLKESDRRVLNNNDVS